MAECKHGIEDATCELCHPSEIMTGRGRPAQRPEWAAVIKSWIPAVGNDWISGNELAEVSGLTRPQLSAAIAHLRDHEPDFPLVSGTEGYRFSLDEADVNRYRDSATRTAHTRIRRAWRGVVKPYVEITVIDPVEVRRITRSFERLLEDLNDMIG